MQVELRHICCFWHQFCLYRITFYSGFRWCTIPFYSRFRL